MDRCPGSVSHDDSQQPPNGPLRRTASEGNGPRAITVRNFPTQVFKGATCCHDRRHRSPISPSRRCAPRVCGDDPGLAKAAGAGHRAIGARFSVPAGTVRGWLRVIEGQAELVCHWFGAVAVTAGMATNQSTTLTATLGDNFGHECRRHLVRLASRKAAAGWAGRGRRWTGDGRSGWPVCFRGLPVRRTPRPIACTASRGRRSPRRAARTPCSNR